MEIERARCSVASKGCPESRRVQMIFCSNLNDQREDLYVCLLRFCFRIMLILIPINNELVLVFFNTRINYCYSEHALGGGKGK